jgi:hypothetical protein
MYALITARNAIQTGRSELAGSRSLPGTCICKRASRPSPARSMTSSRSTRTAGRGRRACETPPASPASIRARMQAAVGHTHALARVCAFVCVRVCVRHTRVCVSDWHGAHASHRGIAYHLARLGREPVGPPLSSRALSGAVPIGPARLGARSSRCTARAPRVLPGDCAGVAHGVRGGGAVLRATACRGLRDARRRRRRLGHRAAVRAGLSHCRRSPTLLSPSRLGACAQVRRAAPCYRIRDPGC